MHMYLFIMCCSLKIALPSTAAPFFAFLGNRTVSKNLWKEIIAVAERQNIPIHFHCAQSVEEVHRAAEYCEKVHTPTLFERRREERKKAEKSLPSKVKTSNDSKRSSNKNNNSHFPLSPSPTSYKCQQAHTHSSPLAILLFIKRREREKKEKPMHPREEEEEKKSKRAPPLPSAGLLVEMSKAAVAALQKTPHDSSERRLAHSSASTTHWCLPFTARPSVCLYVYHFLSRSVPCWASILEAPCCGSPPLVLGAGRCASVVVVVV